MKQVLGFAILIGAAYLILKIPDQHLSFSIIIATLWKIGFESYGFNKGEKADMMKSLKEVREILEQGMKK